MLSAIKLVVFRQRRLSLPSFQRGFGSVWRHLHVSHQRDRRGRIAVMSTWWRPRMLLKILYLHRTAPYKEKTILSKVSIVLKVRPPWIKLKRFDWILPHACSG